MISHKYKCIFIHIPKCAGTSIEKALGHFGNYVGIDRQDHRSVRVIEQPFIKPCIFSSKENICDILRRVRYKYRIKMNPNNKITVTKKQYDEYYKFTIVRNPWSRAFSCYKNILDDELHRKNYKVTKEVSLKDFLKRYAGKGLLRPQTYWLKSFDGSIKLDYVGRFETLTQDFQKICDHLHISHIELPHELKGTGQDYAKYYDEESIKIISGIYKEEIELFNYSFT